MGGFEAVLVFVGWALPILLIVYVFRALGAIIQGMRSINAAGQRIATAVEYLGASPHRYSRTDGG